MNQDAMEQGRNVLGLTGDGSKDRLIRKQSANNDWISYLLPCIGLSSDDEAIRAKSWTICSSCTFLNVIFWPLLIIFAIIPALSNSSNNSVQISPEVPVFTTIFPVNYGTTGVRYAGGDNLLLVGTTGAPLEQVFNISSFVYLGSIADIPFNINSSNLYVFNPTFPNETVISSSLYGPNTPYYDSRIAEDNIIAVGSYYTAAFNYEKAFIYEGPLNGTGVFTKIILPPRYIENNESVIVEDPVALTLGHSTMGDLVVGDIYYESSPTRGKGFIYNRITGTNVLVDRGLSTTLYGIWQNGANSNHYTIVGGAALNATIGHLTTAFIENYDLSTNNFSNFRSYPFNSSYNYSSHFEGICSVTGGYTVVSDIRVESTGYFEPYMAFIPVEDDGSFGDIQWFPVNNTKTSNPALVTSANTIIDSTVFGIYNEPIPPGESVAPFRSFYVNFTSVFP